MPSAFVASAQLAELGRPPRRDWAYQGPSRPQNSPKPSCEVEWLRARLDNARMALRLASNPVADRSYASERDKLSLRLKVAGASDRKRLEVLELFDRVQDFKARM